MPAGGRSPRRSGPSTARTSPRIRRPVSAAGATNSFCGHCATACAPTAPIISRYSRIPALRRSPMRMRRAIKAYLFSLPAVRQANRAHDVSFPFSWRFLQNGWKLLFFTPGPFRPAPERSEAYNRGAYLVTALAHCGECHTPRNWFGATEPDRFLAGNPHGPDGKTCPEHNSRPADRHRQLERRGHYDIAEDRPDPGIRLRRRRDGRGRAQHLSPRRCRSAGDRGLPEIASAHPFAKEGSMSAAFDTGRAGGTSYDVGPRQIGIRRGQSAAALIDRQVGGWR